MPDVVILLGSAKDLTHAKKIAAALNQLKIEHTISIASAHKTPEFLLELLSKKEKQALLYVTIAGKSDALSGMVSANTDKPVIASPPYKENELSMGVISTLLAPSGVSHMTVLGPEQTALAVAKIIALARPSLKDEVSTARSSMKLKILENSINSEK
ncbi:AIR carboxylase family protein [Elusimicrobiota bacterium]